MVAVIWHANRGHIQIHKKTQEKGVRERQSIIHGLTQENTLRNSLLGGDCHGL